LPGPRSPITRQNLLANHRLGAEIHVVPSQRAADERARRLAALDPSVYVIPVGGSSPVGNSGFVNAAFELALQVSEGLLPEPDEVVLAMGTMGSAAGLAVGLEAAGLRTRVVAVRASNPGTSPESALRAAALDTSRFLHALDPTFPVVEPRPERLIVIGDALGGGYGLPTAAGSRASELLRERAGVALEPTYGAKAFSALLTRARTSAGMHVLYWVSSSAAGIDVSDVDWRTLPKELHAWVRG
jgi:D-cysteine desulfhydrase